MKTDVTPTWPMSNMTIMKYIVADLFILKYTLGMKVVKL